MRKATPGCNYVDTSGRNDILTAKVAVGRRAIGFYAETADALTPSDGNNWMLLLIDADNDSSTGWYGYDFVINKKVKDGRTTTLIRYHSDSSNGSRRPSCLTATRETGWRSSCLGSCWA